MLLLLLLTMGPLCAKTISASNLNTSRRTIQLAAERVLENINQSRPQDEKYTSLEDIYRNMDSLLGADLAERKKHLREVLNAVVTAVDSDNDVGLIEVQSSGPESFVRVHEGFNVNLVTGDELTDSNRLIAAALYQTKLLDLERKLAEDLRENSKLMQKIYVAFFACLLAGITPLNSDRASLGVWIGSLTVLGCLMTGFGVKNYIDLFANRKAAFTAQEFVAQKGFAQDMKRYFDEIASKGKNHINFHEKGFVGFLNRYFNSDILMISDQCRDTTELAEKYDIAEKGEAL